LPSPLKLWNRPAPPAHHPYHVWLTDRGSLTARILARCSEFSVHRVFQGRARPLRDEAFLLHERREQQALVREVLLIADGIPVVFAHSAVVLADLKGVWHSLSAMGSKPLGAALFADPRVVRTGFTYRRLNAHHPLHRRASTLLDSVPPTLWARRSHFRLQGKPILVTEVFLPAVLKLR
jgi:chorismate--pyruvate lyase